MSKPFFTGCCTALVTPFLNRQVNYPMLEQLLQKQLLAGMDVALVCGTTGESATLSDDEKLEIIRRAKAFVGDQMIIIAGTGSNNTAHAVTLSKAAQDAGADALLVVSPYYNKATPEGLVHHYLAIAHAVKIPIILYNVPSRTGVDMAVSVYRRLANIPNIIGVKEASGDIGKILRICAACPDSFTVWTGNDEMTVPAISLGAKGVISVAGNVYPEEMQNMAMAALDGDFDTAASLQRQLLPLTDALFSEVNPIPVKAAMKCIGFDCGGCRLPLTEASAETFDVLRQILI
ncbi:MAG: 4-hydroxy-tetrahydrodipicolinate synthase [Oscillospiraceae bacterium]|nr:4-hydroxy-tetrahydrodipicolinate synthase [Oscillospiraceae bacterium]